MTVRDNSLASQPPYHPDMDRRGFLLTSLAGALAAPLAAEGQQAGKTYRVGWLALVAPARFPELIDAFRRGMREHGYLEMRRQIAREGWWN